MSLSFIAVEKNHTVLAILWLQINCPRPYISPLMILYLKLCKIQICFRMPIGHNSTNLVSSSLFKSFILTMFLLGLLIFYSDVSFNFGYSNLLRKDTSIFMIISLFGPMPYSHRTSTAEHHKWSSNDLFSFIYSSSILLSPSISFSLPSFLYLLLLLNLFLSPTNKYLDSELRDL